MNNSCFAFPDGMGSNEVGAAVAVPCNHVVGSPNHFTNVVSYSQYGYNQIAWAVYLFTALNALALVILLVQGVYFRMFWTLPTLAAGAAVETIGWAGRIWSLKSTVWDPNYGGVWYSNYNGFLMQIICLVIAPTFFSAANYVLLNRLVRVTGGSFSSITPDSFTTMFVVADVACLVVQGIGGGLAGSANTTKDADNGAYVMTGGVCLQLLITVIFVGFYGEFVWRYWRRAPATKQYDITAWFKCGAARVRSRERHDAYMSTTSLSKIESGGDSVVSTHERRTRVWIATFVLGFATLLITIRGVFRSVELTNGWRGPIAINQSLFLGMDPLLMILLLIAYIVYHPGLALSNKNTN